MRYFFVILFLCGFCLVQAQDPKPETPAGKSEPVDIRKLEQIHKSLGGFVLQVKKHLQAIPRMSERRIKNVEEDLTYIQTKWDLYTQKNMELINNEAVDNVSLVGEFNATVDAIKVAIENQRAVLAVSNSMEKVTLALPEYENQLNELYAQAEKLSTVKQAAKQLEKVKAEAQLTFDELTKMYQAAKSAIPEDNLTLNERFAKIEESYIRVSALSNSIQELKYVPFIQRIKDYLLSIGAVAVVLMLFNMILTKIKAAKSLKESLMKMKEATQNNDIPTI